MTNTKRAIKVPDDKHSDCSLINGSITLTYDENISTLMVNIGGVIVTMVLDAGASAVSISQDVEMI